MAASLRIQAETYSKLRELADETGLTMQEVLAEAIDELYCKRFIEACNRAYSQLKSDATAWKQEVDECQAWDATLFDGLEDA